MRGAGAQLATVDRLLSPVPEGRGCGGQWKAGLLPFIPEQRALCLPPLGDEGPSTLLLLAAGPQGGPAQGEAGLCSPQMETCVLTPLLGVQSEWPPRLAWGQHAAAQ